MKKKKVCTLLEFDTKKKIGKTFFEFSAEENFGGPLLQIKKNIWYV